MTGQEAFCGSSVHHLYRECPALLRLEEKGVGRRYEALGRRCTEKVDPMGADICDLCQRVWIGEHDV